MTNRVYKPIDILEWLTIRDNGLGLQDITMGYDEKIDTHRRGLRDNLSKMTDVDQWLRAQYETIRRIVNTILSSPTELIANDQFVSNAIDQLAPDIDDDVKAIATQYISRYRYLFAHNNAAIEAKLNMSKRLAQSQFTKDIDYNTDYEHTLLYQHYLKRWSDTHNKEQKRRHKHEPTGSLPLTLPDELIGPFGNKLIDYVVNQSTDDGLLSSKRFEQLVSHWPDPGVSINECYNAYLDLYARQPGQSIKIGDVEIRGSGYKTKNKPIRHNYEPTNYFPTKHNRRYMLHTVTRPHTYFIDLMYCGKLTFLIAIEGNTRYIYAEMTNLSTSNGRVIVSDVKNTRRYIAALTAMMKRGMRPRYIIGDAEKAFKSNNANAFYRSNNIRFIPVPRLRTNYMAQHEAEHDDTTVDTEPYHTSLALVDRAIRTIRDMAYNMRVPQHKLNQTVMEWILHEYNNSYHNTLSRYAGFNVTPAMVHNDRNLEQRICNAIHAANWNIMHEPGFMLADGMRVKVYNDRDKMGKRRRVIRPGEWIVEGWERGKYKVKNNDNGDSCVMPRYKLAPEWA